MDVKEKAKHAYNQAADLWHQSRQATLDNSPDPKFIKQNRPHLFVEKPAMYAKVPDLSGRDVLALGCGSGEECDFLLSRDPASLTGVDISEELIKIARGDFPTVKFMVMDAEQLTFDDASFDYIYCSLLLDYFKTWDRVMAEIYRVLRPRGILLFSNLHPVKWAAERTLDDSGKATGVLMGYQKDPETGEQRVLGDYLNTQLHSETWMKGIPISFYTKSISQMFKEVTSSGLRVIDIVEPKAIPETREFSREYWEANQRIPNFIIFEALKEGN